MIDTFADLERELVANKSCAVNLRFVAGTEWHAVVRRKETGDWEVYRGATIKETLNKAFPSAPKLW